MLHHQLIRAGTAALIAAILSACAADNTGPTGGGGDPIGPTKAWSDPATWPSGHVPVDGDSVTIPAGLNVSLDTSPPALTSLRINGALVVADKNITLTSGWIVVAGKLQIGTEVAPFNHRITITLTGSPDDGNIDGMGNKMIGVSGTIDMHGQHRVGWTHLAATAAAGATTLSLATAAGWHAGERIVLASSDYDGTRAEEAVIATTSGTSVTLTAPLHFAHSGVTMMVHGVSVDERAEVGLLTRNITIQGDTGTTPGYGGHMMILAGATARIEGVQLFQMGQRGHLARYPMHWHVAGDVHGQYFRSSSVWRTFNRCVTVHGSDNATVSDNVCYDHTGHGYFLEDGAETGNTFSGNLGLVSRIPQGADRFLASDATPATFWITNPDNSYTHNVAAGSRGFGFWCAFPAAPTGLSTGEPNLPRTTPLREFSDNVAHSNNDAGLNVDNGPRADGTTEATYYAPRLDPANSSDPVEAVFKNFHAYLHRGRAVWLRGASLALQGALLSDNGIGATFAANQSGVRQSTFIGQSGIPASLPSGTLLRGYEFYDGVVSADNVTFINYTAATTVPASALGYNRNNAFPINPENFAGQLTFINANQVYLDDPAANADGDKAAAFLDRDGRVTGTAMTWVVARVPLMNTSGCTLRAAWNAYICHQRYVQLGMIDGANGSLAGLSVVRDNGPSLTLSGIPNNLFMAYFTGIPGAHYTMQWPGTPPPNPKVYLNAGKAGDAVWVTMPYPAAPTSIVRDYWAGNPMTPVAALSDLNASTGNEYFYDSAAHQLTLKLVVMDDRDWGTLFVNP
jgi:cell migration-inducing and hyaluronan-binding protein